MNDIRKAYDYRSAQYDSDTNLTRDLDRTMTREILIDLQCNLVVEIGCGTGKNTLFLSQIASEVHAIDFSEAMISKAKDKLNEGRSRRVCIGL